MEEISPIETETDDTIEDRFWRFHYANPQVFKYLKLLALSMKERGHDHYSINSLFETLRYVYDLKVDGGRFKLNNNYRSRYARMLMEEVPELEGFFRVRELKTESVFSD